MKVVWTEHSKIKMKQYGLSKQKILSIFHKPERTEQAIVPGLIASMRTNKTFFKEKKVLLKDAWKKPKKTPGEVWLMYKKNKDCTKIISTWRYPGVSKSGEEIPIPEDIRYEILNNKIK
jgi:hypothetical protein